MLLNKKTTEDVYLIGASGWIGHAFRAIQLINNLRWLGDERSIYVITDRHHNLFRNLDNVLVKTVPPTLHYFCTVKLFPYSICPFAKRIMWLDTDMFIPKKLDTVWELNNQLIYVNTCSADIIEEKEGSRWFFWNIAHTVNKLDIPHVYCLQNGWILYTRHEPEFDKYINHIIDRFIELKLRMYIDNKQYCDEPVLGVALAKFGIKPCELPIQYRVEDSQHFEFKFGYGTRFHVSRTNENKQITVEVTPAIAHFSGTTKFGDWRKSTWKTCVWYRETLYKAPWEVDYKIMDNK